MVEMRLTYLFSQIKLPLLMSAVCFMLAQLFSLANRSRGGFTVVELLVVLAILMTLTVLMVPAINSALEAGRRSRCLSGLRTLAQGTLLYAADNDGYLPGPTFRSQRSPLRSPPPSTNYISRILTDEGYVPLSAQVWHCPSNRRVLDYGNAMLAYVVNNRQSTDPPRYFGSINPLTPTIRLSEIRSSGLSDYITPLERGPPVTDLASIWMYADIDGVNFNAANSGGAASSLHEHLHPPPHSGGRNYVFFDGHARHHTPDDWPVNPH